ncbi:hypothetical protein SLEP1_g13120 [Rubroshorea leprosula]|uniref:Uncharacterized protein n=1 Tax=Rubroshorea leprosula TaxID=152421 RepID=A0AAV5IKN6_9ROSI|nr:hypothetical protein SLEP1_g13120 [Rubroshorea leprosula]
MSIALSQQSFLTNSLTLTPKPRTGTSNSVAFISCRCQQDEPSDSSRRNDNQLAKLAIVTLAAGVLTVVSVGDAYAAKTGGRVGGQAFRSSAPRSFPRIDNNSRNNVFINPPVAPPLVGGYGYGYGVPFYGGGWGWSPYSSFTPGPSIAIGVGGGLEVLVLLMFLGAIAAVVRRLLGSGDEEEY